MKAVKKLILLDVHAILHRAYHALPGFKSTKGEPTGALYGLSAFLIKIIADLKPDYIVACFDLPGPTFRKKVYDEYKAGRAKTDEDLVAQIIRSKEVFKAFGIPVYEKAGFEADDIIGTVAEIVKKDRGIQVFIASGDMDTLQLVDGDRVVVYTLRKGLNDTVIYDESAVKERYGFGPGNMADYKGLRGDPSDNIIGIKGIGEKTGSDLIKNFGSIESIYQIIKKDQKVLLDVGIKQRIINLLKEGEEEAIFSKMLATIRRDVSIDFKLPGKIWADNVELSHINKLFQDLEFRTLGPRLRSVLFSGVLEEERNTEVPVTDKDLLRRLEIAVWLLNSDINKPTLDDILSMAKTDNINKAEEKLIEEIKSSGLEKVYNEIELPIMPIIKRAEDLGIFLNVRHLEDLSKKHHKELKDLEKKIWQYAGVEFNINSPKQLGEVIFDKMGLTAKGLRKTAGGARSTKESELLKLKESHPIIDELLKYREIQKLLSTYIDPLPTQVDKNSRLHTSLDQMGTTTGRLSSNNPNLQNIPASGEIAKEIRRAFVATPGYKIAAFDYSQIEMRVLAWLSGDKALIDIFKNGRDIHSAVASKVFGVSESEVTKEMRRKAKVINFGIIYGMGVTSLKKNLGSTMEEAQTFYNNFFKQFPKIQDYFDKVKNEARTKGYTTTAYGRRRYFPMINSSLPFVRSESERMAVNAPIQGTATADIIKLAMSRVDEKLTKGGLIANARLLLQVHDELLYEIKDNHKIDEVVLMIKHTMETVDRLPVPLVVNVSTGDNWGDLITYAQT
ncbi:MAG: hypothetical protein HY225_02705 [Candidatus Vogelbacteria bacterium]|nr:hypothetical protein [Candidatus Vogelbacteria bacterium]